jgi:hypothetical protein
MHEALGLFSREKADRYCDVLDSDGRNRMLQKIYDDVAAICDIYW